MGSISALLLKSNSIFTYQELATIWNVRSKNQLERRVDYLVSKGMLKRLMKGIFSVVGREYNENELANKIRPLSYISFETVLVKEGYIFQAYTSIFSSSNLTREYEINNKKFIYRRIKEEILLDPLGIKKTDSYYIASAERALLDMLYIDKSFPIDNINKQTFDIGKAREIATIYNSKSLLIELNKLIKNFL